MGDTLHELIGRKKTPFQEKLTLLDWLFKPSRKIKDPRRRRNARLLSVFLVFMFVLFLSINLLYALTIPEYKFPAADLIGYGFLAVIYILSRTRFLNAAIFLMLIMFPMNVFQNVFGGTSINLVATLSYLLPSFVLASIFLSKLWTAVYGYGLIVFVILLPKIAPQAVPGGLSDILGFISVAIIVVTLCIIWSNHRDNIEVDRQNEMREAYDFTLKGWSQALEIRDMETQDHSLRVTNLTLKLGEIFGFKGQALEYLYRGAIMHDIGKIAIPDSILMKQTALDEEERSLMQTHPKVAHDMLSKIPFLRPSLAIPAFHHEWWNGQGYPFGLKGEEIPLSARIFAVVDVWDALLSDRPYRKAWPKAQVLEYIENQSGTQFDPAVVEKFLPLTSDF